MTKKLMIFFLKRRGYALRNKEHKRKSMLDFFFLFPYWKVLRPKIC